MIKLRKEARNDPAKRKDLADLCQFVANNKHKSRYHSDSCGDWEQEYRRTMLQHEASAAALQCERLDLYDKLVAGSAEFLPLEIFHLLGWTMGRAAHPESLRNRYVRQMSLSTLRSSMQTGLTIRQGRICIIPCEGTKPEAPFVTEIHRRHPQHSESRHRRVRRLQNLVHANSLAIDKGRYWCSEDVKSRWCESGRYRCKVEGGGYRGAVGPSASICPFVLTNSAQGSFLPF